MGLDLCAQPNQSGVPSRQRTPRRERSLRRSGSRTTAGRRTTAPRRLIGHSPRAPQPARSPRRERRRGAVSRWAGHVGDESRHEALSPTDDVHDARAQRAAHELERALLPGPRLLATRLLSDEPEALVGVGHIERQAHEHHAHLIRGAAAPRQRNRDRDRERPRNRLAQRGQRRPVARRNSGEKSIVHGAAERTRVRRQRFEAHVEEPDAVNDAAWAEERGSPDAVIDQRHESPPKSHGDALRPLRKSGAGHRRALCDSTRTGMETDCVSSTKSARTMATADIPSAIA